MLTLTSRLKAIQPILNALKVDDLSFPIEEWLPDLPASENPGMLTLKNVYPVTGGVRPLRQFITVANGIQGKCFGVNFAQGFNGTNYLYAGTADKLWEAGNAFTDVSKVGGYSTGTGENWVFQQFENTVIATNFSNPIQFKQLDTQDAFSDLATSTVKPRARHMSTLGQYLLIGNTFDDVDGTRPNRVWWTPDTRDWDPDAANRIDFEDFKDGGAVTGIVGNLEFGLVFQTNTIRRMSIVPTIQFDIDPIDRLRGTPFPRTIGWTGRRAYFYSEDGVHYNDGSGSVPVGYGKVDNAFGNTIDRSRLNEISTAVDRRNGIIIWALPSGATSKRLFILNYRLGRWAEAEVNIEVLAEYRAPGSDLDDPTAPDVLLDDTSYPDLDSEFWKGGTLKLGGINDGKLLSAEGPPEKANWVFGDKSVGGNGQTRFLVNEVWPQKEGASSCSVRVGARDNLGVAPDFGPWSVVDGGKASVFVNGRYFRVEMEVAAGTEWSFARGVRCSGLLTGENV